MPSVVSVEACVSTAIQYSTSIIFYTTVDTCCLLWLPFTVKASIPYRAYGLFYDSEVEYKQCDRAGPLLLGNVLRSRLYRMTARLPYHNNYFTVPSRPPLKRLPTEVVPHSPCGVRFVIEIAVPYGCCGAAVVHHHVVLARAHFAALSRAEWCYLRYYVPHSLEVKNKTSSGYRLVQPVKSPPPTTSIRSPDRWAFYSQKYRPLLKRSSRKKIWNKYVKKTAVPSTLRAR